jgi:transposase
MAAAPSMAATPSTPPAPAAPSSTPHTPPPRTTRHTTRNERLQVQTLRDAGLTYTQIHEQLNLTLHQVAYAVNHPLTPKKRSGRPSTLTHEEIDYIIDWVCAKNANRRASWSKIPILLGLDVSYYTIRNALRNAGFSRCVARRKPPISERNRISRLRWAIKHISWTIEEWKMIL